MMRGRPLSLRVNGETHDVVVEDHRTLLEVLREDLGLTGTKHGCELGECGACTVDLDGQPVLACLTLALDTEGREVRTVEGLLEGGRPDPLQSAFAEVGAAQCGYCTPGMLASAGALLRTNPYPTREDVRQALSGNLCRCTGYRKILDAVLLVAERTRHNGPDRRSPAAPAAPETAAEPHPAHPDGHGPGEDGVSEDGDPGYAVVGKRLPKVDALARVTGQTRYASDLALPGMLVGKLLRSVHPHALIRAIDTSRAQALSGVHAVLTGRDLPVAYGILPVSQDEHALAPERVRYVGEPVAAVAAVDEQTAQRALAAITVDYEPLPAVLTIDDALAEDTIVLHEGNRRGNIHRVAALEFGDVEDGFAQADHIREDTFFFGGNTHAPIEEHASLADLGADGRLTLWSSTQVPHYLHRALIRVLGLPAGQIRVVATPSGGGFGAKSDVFSHEVVAAKLAVLTGRPVKITLSREEVFACHRGRHPVLMRVRSGFTRDGRITAMHFRSYLDGGAYGSYGAASTYYTGALQTTTYRIPRYRFEGARVFTNKPPCGPKRGHGTPQPRFAIERHLDQAARDLGLSPVDIRLRNLVEPFSRTANHLRITSCGLRECVDRVLAASGFRDKHGALPEGRGVGFAVSAYLSGAGLPIYWNDMPQSEVQIKVDRGGGVTVYSGAADIGQGSTSVLAAIVAEVLGLRPEDLAMVTADTDLTPVDLGSYSSRVTFMAGNAALDAARKMRELILQASAERLDVPPDRLVLAAGRVFERGDPQHGLTWPQAVRAAGARTGALVTTGNYWAPDLAGPYKGSGVGPSPAYSYSACVAAVRCDRETGEVTVEDVWLAHDVGRAINPAQVEGQIEGGVAMGIGEALMEEHAFHRGLHRSPSLLDYKLPSTLETPTIHSILVETDDPEGPFGAKEAGQGPLLPVIPAVAAAVEDALGVRIDEVPITAEKIQRVLRKLARGQPGRLGPDEVPALAFPELIRVEPPSVDTPVLDGVSPS